MVDWTVAPKVVSLVDQTAASKVVLKAVPLVEWKVDQKVD